MCATLLGPFEYVRIYQPFPGAIFFTASDSPIRPEAMDRLPLSPSDVPEYYRYGLNSPENLLACLVADRRAVQQLAKRGR